MVNNLVYILSHTSIGLFGSQKNNLEMTPSFRRDRPRSEENLDLEKDSNITQKYQGLIKEYEKQMKKWKNEASLPKSSSHLNIRFLRI